MSRRRQHDWMLSTIADESFASMQLDSLQLYARRATAYAAALATPSTDSEIVEAFVDAFKRRTGDTRAPQGMRFRIERALIEAREHHENERKKLWKKLQRNLSKGVES